MIVLAALALACAPKPRAYEYVAEPCQFEDLSDAPTLVQHGSPVPFTPVPVPEGLGLPPDWVPPPAPSSIAAVEVVTSEEAWERFNTSGSDEVELPSFDFDSVSVLVTHLTWGSVGHRLEVTNVRDTGSGTLQVDLTFHRSRIGLLTIGTMFAIVTVPRGEYVATPHLTMACYGERRVRR